MAGPGGRYAAMMDPVTLMLLSTAPAVLKVADTLAQSRLLRARAELAKAQAAARTQDKPAGDAQ